MIDVAVSYYSETILRGSRKIQWISLIKWEKSWKIKPENDIIL